MNLDIIEKGYYEVWVDGKKVSQHSKSLKASMRGQEEQNKNKDAEVIVKQPNLKIELTLSDDESDIESLKLKIEELQKKEIMYLSIIESLKNSSGSGVVTPVDSTLAFPSAIGAGAYVTGGRGGTVVHVTTTQDNVAGSLREALTMTVKREIVIDVSGVFTLNSLLALGTSNSDFTLNGQSAPEGGITIDGDRVYIESVNQCIVRHVRFKGGIDADNTPNSGDGLGNDSLTVTGDITNQIWDHCSFGFGADECASWYTTNSSRTVNNLTVQRCLFTESVKGCIIGKEEDVFDVEGKITFVNNLFYNSGYRYPNIAGTGYRFDIFNNVSWSRTGRLIRGNGSFKLNHQGNYYDFGDSSVWAINDQRLQLFSYGQIPQIYTTGNKIVSSNLGTPLTNTLAEMNADNTLSWKRFNFGDPTYGDQLPSNYFTGSQFSLLGKSTTILTADEALANVSIDVGCNKRLNADGTTSANIDTLDADALNQIKLGNYTTPLDKSSYNVPSITSVSRGGTYYVSNSHIPEAYITAKGLTGTSTIHTELAPSGYTWLEEFLNEVDE
tara:strand:+ start:7474 stop:9135 length:1662 start_codon:yes stop_codon:yes gene_type:complete